uniref:Uncharacterized protein n=1 Tax=Haplochromis burtoni TaxID=8153 RepID=A0A3Q3CZ01_HAPBU
MVDPQENSPHDIPDYDGIADEAFPPLPPPHSPGRGGQEEGDPFADGRYEGEVSQLADVPTAKRRGVKRPQPKGLKCIKMRAHRKYLPCSTGLNYQHCLKLCSGVGDEEVQHELETFGDPDLFSRESFINAPQGQIAEALAPPPTPSLTEEQQKRIELNRQRALEKRLARQQQIGSTDGDETVEDPDLEPSNNTSTQQTSPLPPKDSEPAEAETGLSPEQQLSNDCVGGD